MDEGSKAALSGRRKFLAGVASAAGGAAVLPVLSLGSARAADLGLLQAINRAGAPGADAEVAAKHVPVFTVPESFKDGDVIPVTIHVGAKHHVMEEDHHIESLRVFLNNTKLIADVRFGIDDVQPSVTVFVKATKGLEIVAQSFCNQHGIWEGRHKM